MSSGGPPRSLWILATAAGYFFGGLFTLSLASSVAMRSLQSFMEAKRKKVAPPCAVCKGKGFYGCKLCKGKSTIEWSPLYDPIVINPCICPTCEGNKSNPEVLELSWEGLCMINHMMEHNYDFDQVSLIALEIGNKVQGLSFLAATT